MHQHFDVNEVLSAYDKVQVEAFAAIDANIDKSAAIKAMEKRSGELVGRAALHFIVECRNAGYGHEEVAEIFGGMLASMAAMAIENFPCRCTRGRIMAAFSLNLGAMLAGDPDTLAGPLVKISPMQGGRA